MQENTRRTLLIRKNRVHRKIKLLRGARYSVGIDEVGRGSLAGPVTVAAVAIPKSLIKLESLSRIFANKNSGRIRDTPLRDSKKLSPKQREEWFSFIQEHPKINYAVASVYPRNIERMNISRAANLAALRAYGRLSESCHMSHVTCRVYLDGGLYLGSSKWQMANGKSAKTVTKGDEKFTAVKLASIMAKVSRDRFMTRLAKKYPVYGFEIHKGYGTKTHTKAIKKHGPSEAHRLTFIGKYYKK